MNFYAIFKVPALNYSSESTNLFINPSYKHSSPVKRSPQNNNSNIFLGFLILLAIATEGVPQNKPNFIAEQPN